MGSSTYPTFRREYREVAEDQMTLFAAKGVYEPVIRGARHVGRRQSLETNDSDPKVPCSLRTLPFCRERWCDAMLVKSRK